MEMIVPADDGRLLPTPLASIDGVDDGPTEASGVGDAVADFDGFGRVVLEAVGVGVGVAVRVGREETT